MGKNKTRSAKLFAFLGMAILGVAVAAIAVTVSQAQSSGIKPLQLSSVTSVSSSNPAGNYYWSSTGKLWNDNYGISLWTGNFPTPYTECGTLGMAGNLSNTTDPQQANIWENRNTCNGYIAVGAADKVGEQTLTVSGVTSDGKALSNFQINVPAITGTLLGNWKLYVDDIGATYYCRSDHSFAANLYPNDCDLTIEQALVPQHLARAGNAPVAGNGLCQTGESSYTTPQDCGNPKTFSGQAAFQSGDAGGTIENNGIIKQKVINLKNTGSHPDTFRTTLPINPESRCGLRTSDGSYPSNTLPNPLSTMLDTALAVNESKYISAVCVTNGLAAGPFTWSYKTVSLGAVEVNRPDVNTVLAEVQDTVAVTVPISCTDSDNGQSYSVKGTATGTYAGATPGYIKIYGQEPDPLTPKATTNNYSTFIDHCANATQLNEAFCDASGKMSAIGIQCPNGCSGGVCLSAAVSDTPAAGRVTQLFPGQYSNTKFSITIDDTDGIKEFSVKKANNTSVYGGSPGASGNVGACGGANMYKTLTSGTVTLESADFPLNMTVTDCRTGAAAYSTTIPALGSVSSSCTGINLSTTKTSYTKGENVNYTYSCAAPSASAVISYIAVQVVKPDGIATTYNTGTNVSTSQSMGFSTSNLDAGSYLIRTCLNSTCSAGSTNSVPFTITAATTTTTTTTTTTVPADSSLVGYWKFDGNGTNEVADKPAAAVSGNASFNAAGGKIGGYLYVPTATDSAKIPYNSVYDLPDSFTIEFWFRQRANQSANQNLIYKGSAPNNYNFNISRWLWNEYNQGPVIAGHTAANTGFWTQPSNPNHLAHNEWHHVAFTKSPDYHAYYLDGVLIGSKDITASSNSEYGGPAKTPHTEIIIGDTAIDTDFDDLKIYNRALTLAEISQNGPFPSAATTTTTTTTTTTPTTTTGTTTTTTSGTSTTATPPASTTPSACATGEKCVKGSWCSGGQQCFYPDEQLTCVAWPAMASGATAAMSGPMDQPACPAGTSPCRPTDSQCAAPGQSVPASSGKWCGASTAYYSKDGATMYCAASKSTVPAGYSACRSTDTTCKQKGDKWTDTNSSYYCMYAQKCNNPAGGGSCVSWDETCPAGTKYCNATDTNCIEPGEYKTIAPGSANSYWCGGGSGMTFHSSTQSYCAPKKAGTMWVGADIKEVLERLGAGWGVCRPSDTNCIEPGKTGTSNGWCGWSPPGYMMSPASSSNSEKRTCPSLDGAATVTTTVTPQTPVVPGQEPVVTNQVVVPPSVVPGQIRECSENEMPGMANNCRMPMYRWNIGARTWEKCDSNKPPVYVNVKDNPKAAYTNCESFNMAVEKDWRTERFQVRDPVKYGEWYMPAWDAATVSLQYDPASDQLGECKTNVAIMPVPGQMPQYVSPCMPIPAEDKSWMLKKFRAEYKMSQIWRSQQTSVLPTTPAAQPVPGRPVAVQPVEEFPILPLMPAPVIPTVPASQCRGYLIGIRGNINGDKQFWKDMKSQFKQAPADYADADTIKKLLDDSKTLIVEIEKLVKGNKCDSANLAAIQEKQNNLHQDIFSELSSYMPDLHDFVQYQQCANNLKDKSAQLNKLLGNGIEDESKAIIEELISEIEEKSQELKANVSDFEYDAKFECEQFSEEIDFEMMPLVRAGDKELNRIIDDVVEIKLRPAMDELSKKLEDRDRKIDSLIVQVAELHKAVEEISKSAVQISEQITTSYTALSRMSEEFEEQKTQIQEAKDTLIPLVETAISMMKNKRCVGNADRELMVQELGNAAAVNWYGERADEMEKRFNLFIASCEQKNVTPADILAFKESIKQAAQQNQKISYEQHLTPFVDVPTHEWYYGGMVCGDKAGFMTQGRPMDTVLKQEALLMIMRAAGMPENEVTGDCALQNKLVTDVSPYAVCAVNKAAEKGIDLRGSVVTPISRIEITQLVAKLIELPETKPDVLKAYTDLAGLSGAEKDAVAAVVSNEIMVGTVRPDASTFGPRDLFTRGSLAVVLDKVLKVRGETVCSK